MAEYSKIIDGSFTIGTTATAKFLSLPMVPDTFEWWNLSNFTTPNSTEVLYGIAFNGNNGKAYVTQNNATPVLVGRETANNICQFISAGTYSYGPTATITGIVASTGVATTSAAHGFAVGDTVLLTATTGMLQVSGYWTTVTAVGSTTTFTIGNIPTSGFSNATAGFAKKVLFADLYIPFLNYITGVTQGNGTTTGPTTQTVITCSVNPDFVVGQEVAFVLPQPTTTSWGMNQLDSEYVVRNTGVPQRAYVTAVFGSSGVYSSIAANQFVVNVNSTGFSTFTYPTSAQIALGVTFPQVMSIGDGNSGYTLSNTGVPPFLGVQNGIIGIPGSFAANTRQGILLAPADSTSSVIFSANDVIRFRAIFPDSILLNQ